MNSPATETAEQQSDSEDVHGEPPGTADDDFCRDATEADLRALAEQLGFDDDDDDDDDDDEGEAEEGGDFESFLADLEDDIDAFLADLEGMPTGLRRAAGECLWIGFDAEWVFDELRQQNRIISIQLYVPPQPALSKDEGKAAQIAQLSRLILAEGPDRGDRPELRSALRQLVDTALERRLIAEEPKLIYIVGFGLRFDLGALADFEELKRQVDSVAGKVATVKSHAQLEFSRSMITGDGLEPIMIGLHFIDVAAHVPPGKALRDIGQLIELPKLEIPAPYSIERMDEYLRLDPEGFRGYAMRDAEIAVRYAMRLANFARDELQIATLPATASGLALLWYLRTLKESGIDRLDAFGLQKVVKEAYHAPSKRRRTFKEEEPIPMRKLQEALTSACYAGGRNEAMWLGPTEPGEWIDYDLAGAYSTGLMDLPLIDFDKPRVSLTPDDYCGHVAGYALIDFEHQPDTRFPVFAISRGGKGLIFPLKGTCYATAPEIQAARDLDCKVTIRWGIVYPWRLTPDDELIDGVPRVRLFGDFIKAARQLRNRLKKELKAINATRLAKGKKEIESLEEQAAKLYANSIYGKVCQSIVPKNVFDTRQVRSTRLKPSPITNSAIGAHVTGFIRAILAEILNQIPRERTVISCTTDGFLTDATEVEMKACLSGPLCRRFQRLCDDIDPDTKIEMLEVKHRVSQLVCMKTRGQLTAAPLAMKDGGEHKIVLAKAGTQPVIKAPPDLDPESYKKLQNEKMLNLYLDRRPGKKVLLGQFPSIRDQWEKGVDLHKFERRILLSLEPDLKRKLVAPREIEIQGRRRRHLAMSTQPWETVEDFDVARAQVDAWRRQRNLKTLEDWRHLDESLQLGAVRGRKRRKGEATLNIRAGRGACDALRRAFLRVYAHRALGFTTRPLTYPALAEWLTSIGSPTTAKEVTSARSQKLVLGVVPATDEVVRLWRQLQERFPENDLRPLLSETPPMCD